MVKAYPGTYIVKLLKEKLSTQVTSDKNKRILKGEVISVGAETETKYGGSMKPKAKVGDIIYFLSYEGGYDRIDEKTLSVLFDDGRGFEA